MFRHTMVRSTLVLAAALAAVSATGLADVASAATTPPIRAVTVTQVKPLPVPGITTAPRINSGPRLVRSSFSADMPGFNDDACEGLRGDYNNAAANADAAKHAGDIAASRKWSAVADAELGVLTDNCVVIF